MARAVVQSAALLCAGLTSSHTETAISTAKAVAVTNRRAAREKCVMAQVNAERS
jgi:hypothetical protein